MTGHIRLRWGARGRERLSAGFPIPGMAVAGIAMLLLSCGDGAVEPPPPPPAPVATTVTVNPASATLTALEGTARFTAEVRDQNGQAMAGATAAWATSDASVASVDASGQVTAVTNGSATITATAGSISGSAAVTVAQAVSAVAVSPPADTLVAFGDTLRLEAEATDANGHAVAAVTEFAWSSSDTLVARVDASGLVESLAEGEAVVMATASGVTGDAELSVVSPLPTTLAVSPDTVRFTALGQTAQLAAEVRDQAGRVMAEALVSWSSGDTLVAVVDSAGLVTAAGAGATTVTAAAGDVSGTVAVTVNFDRAALVALYEATDGPNWLNNENWLTDAPLGEWYGVEVDGSGRVVSIDLAGRWIGDDIEPTPHGLAGPIPTELGQLSKLTRLYLELNQLTGPIPPELGDLASLTVLALGNNQLTGLIPPELGQLVSLSELGLGQNNLTGPIPPEVANLANLTRLDLSYNGLSGKGLSGPIPTELASLTGLTFLWLSGNSLTGPIPPELGSLANLTTLWLNDNGLSGPIPSELGELANLKGLALSRNEFSGSIPPELGKLSNLDRLDINETRVTGSIPPQLGDLRNLTDLTLVFNDLTGPIPPELGNLRNLRSLSFVGNRLTGPIPPELGRLSNLTRLFLWGNGLTGPIPPDLGNLTNLTTLFLYTNALTGPIPPELGNLSNLTRLSMGANALTGPIPPELGNLANLTQLNVGDNALTGPIPPELGRLSNLDHLGIHVNLLSGRIPPELGDLDNLTELGFSWNPGLYGPLPEELTRLDLRIFAFEETGVCIPERQAFRTWLQSIELVLEGTVGSCDDLLSHREVLQALYEATNGDGWRVATNWLSDAPLDDWHGVTADSSGMVRAITLPDNELSGVLPLEIGSLETLRELSLNDNPALTGELPPEMVRLSGLAAVHLERTGVCVPDHELFGEWLARIGDARVAECPDDYGDHAGVATAVSLGELVEGELESWRDEDWFLIGTAARGTLTLTTETNSDALVDLLSEEGEFLGYDGDGHNVIVKRLPADVYYVAVKGARDESRGSYTLSISFEPPASGARAYLTQATQSHDFAVPLVAGEDALLRVFVTADSSVTASRPPVRATFYRHGGEIHSLRIDGSSTQVPWTMVEGNLDATANAVVPGEVLVPGVEMVVEIDPEGTLDPALGIGGRIPDEGRMPLDVRAVPDFDVTVVPFLSTENPDSSGYQAAIELTADHELFYETREWLPVADMEVSVRDAVLVDYDPTDMERVLEDLELIHTADGASGYYMGAPPWVDGGLLGIAYLDGKVSVSRLEGHTVAHEFGHNFSLRHAPCGNPLGVDGQYPHVRGKIGAWGYDFRQGTLVDPESFTDLMTYCRDYDWISDYSFAKAADYRTEPQAGTAPRAAGRVLVVRGGTAGGELRLEPAFVLDAPSSLPDERGRYRLVGSDAQGQELFAIGFDMQEVSHPEVEGTGGFTFAIPARAEWAEVLAAITLTGPEGSVALAGDDPSSEATTLMLDAATGRIRAILRDLPGPIAIQADAVGAGPGVEILFSRGIPDPAAWRR